MACATHFVSAAVAHVTTLTDLALLINVRLSLATCSVPWPMSYSHVTTILPLSELQSSQCIITSQATTKGCFSERTPSHTFLCF